MEPCSKSQEWILTSPRGNDSEPSQTVKRRWSTTGSPWTLPEYLPQNDSELRHNIGLTKGSLEPWKWPTVVSTKMRSYNMIYLSSLLGLPVCLFVRSFVCWYFWICLAVLGSISISCFLVLSSGWLIVSSCQTNPISSCYGSKSFSNNSSLSKHFKNSSSQ